MYYDTAFDFDDLPDDDEPDTTLPPKEPDAARDDQEGPPAADASDVVRSDEEAVEPPHSTEPSVGAHSAKEARVGRAHQVHAPLETSAAVNIGAAEIAAAMASKRAEECFLIGPHGRYLDEHHGRLGMVEWTWARPWTFRPVGSAAEPRYLLAQQDLYLAVADGGQQSLRLKAEPGRRGLWALRPVPGDASRCYLLSSEGTFLSSLDDKDQSLCMSAGADEWEQWRCIRVKEPAQVAPPTPAPEAPPPRQGGSAVVAFGLGDFDVSGLVCGSSPHLPVKAAGAAHAAPGHAGAKGREGGSHQKAATTSKEVALRWDGPRADFQVREEVLPMCMASEEMTVQDVLGTWEEWGCKFAGRLKLAAPPGFPSKWLGKSEVIPGHPLVVRLEGPGAILDAVTVALRRNGRKLAEE